MVSRQGGRDLVERIKALDYAAHEAVDWSPTGGM